MSFGNVTIGGGSPAAAAATKDVTSASFRQDVIAESARQPVLVDFWAPWCGPCKQLGPVLEKVVAASQGKVKLVKMNIDDHPEIAGQLGIQSIPAVIAFQRGQPVDGFVGALPESQIKQFLERIAGPMGDPVKEMLEEAAAAVAEGDAQTAAAIYSEILAEDESNGAALAGLARLHLDAGDLDQARPSWPWRPDPRRPTRPWRPRGPPSRTPSRAPTSATPPICCAGWRPILSTTRRGSTTRWR